jgi:outer membrane protein assembly factor BamE
MYESPASHRLSRPALLAVAGLALAAAGCVYRPVIQQGNLLQVDEVEQVKVGMTRSQVRYILGTPMVSDPFLPDRWDYVYTLQQGRSSRVDRTHFVIFFDGDKVSSIEKRDAPEETEIARRVREAREKRAAAEAKAAAGAGGAASPTPASGAAPTTPSPTAGDAGQATTPAPEPATTTPPPPGG